MNGKYGMQTGMTLLELTVVLLILIAVAGLAIPYVGGAGRMAMCQATDATMQAVKQAIMGGAAGPGFYGDTLGFYPQNTKNDLTTINLRYLFTQPAGFNSFNPKTGVGWRGPYLAAGGALVTAGLDSSFANDMADNSGFVHQVISVGEQQVMDAWRRPIVLQIPLDSSNGYAPNFDYARLVSAGPGAGLALGDAAIDTHIEYDSSVNSLPEANDRNDDRVLYLKNPDPYASGNIPCDQL
ncbi:hypothetical protein Q9L42_019290 [Methylomarinum sp. Ch1-1]|uniref:Prepilin-type N-terminal cleavage/methylation domain-containing protein n=1 Tax=Methylomarinum roseum TaxID=3067653 RepID=A0AAU7NTY8_9GAMM|nr:hypothetical protein [Methylomarinum sp. Ch1-1]MDP4519464.1 hypothetical protein [Methylomarinum sp. Ch1-1]